MALLTCIYPGNGTLSTPAAVSSSDTINGNDILAGACLTVMVGGTPTNVTLVDPGRTPAGTAAGSVTPVTVAANTARSWGANYLKNFIDSSNLVTVNYSSTTGATCLLVADGD